MSEAIELPAPLRLYPRMRFAFWNCKFHDDYWRAALNWANKEMAEMEVMRQRGLAEHAPGGFLEKYPYKDDWYESPRWKEAELEHTIAEVALSQTDSLILPDW